MTGKVSNGSKAIYYLGIGLTVLGVILFFSGIMVGNEPDFGLSLALPGFFKRALIGLVCIIVGSARFYKTGSF